MTEQKDKVTVSIELDGVKISASNEDFEHSPGEVFELFRAVFLGSTYTWEQWHKEIINQFEEGE